MSSVLRPENSQQLCDAMAWAVSARAPLEVVGNGSKRGIGRIMQTEASIDTTAMTGILLYEPDELVLSARAGTPLSQIRAALAANNQELAFEPPDLAALTDADGDATIGGVIAANLAGPRRLKAGAVRDHFLGFTAVTGRAEEVKSGGRVMKNVTGYDLPKVLAGSWGTLAVMCDVTVKVLPAAETQATLMVPGLDAQTATVVMSMAMKSSCEVSGAAFIPADLAAGSSIGEVSSLSSSATVLRMEGIQPSVAFRIAKLRGLLHAHTDLIDLDETVSGGLWQEIRDVRYLANDPGRIVWRISVPPSEGAGVLQSISQLADVRGFLDWAGGLIWLDMPVSEHGGAQLVRGAFAGVGGHATLMRGPQSLRAAIPVFEPQPAPLAALTARLKAAFDPEGILNPGRIYAG